MVGRVVEITYGMERILMALQVCSCGRGSQLRVGGAPGQGQCLCIIVLGGCSKRRRPMQSAVLTRRDASAAPTFPTQGAKHFKDIQYAQGVTYGEMFLQSEYEMSGEQGQGRWRGCQWVGRAPVGGWMVGGCGWVHRLLLGRDHGCLSGLSRPA